MRNIKLTLAYDGTDYKGWQHQKNGITIQQVLTEKLERLCKHKITLRTAGRTDAGVHAKGQVTNFQTDATIPIERITKALNGMLPKNIIVYRAEEVEQDFHAGFSATSKTYRYVIDNGAYPDIFASRFAFYEPWKLDVAAMTEVSEIFLGKHDFRSFCAAGGSSKTFVRTIKSLKINTIGNYIYIDITADGFLYHMVRNIVGLLLKTGLGRLTKAQAQLILEACDRTKAPATAPAKGLSLWEVQYEI